MKTIVAIGAVSEILMVAGILSVLYGVGMSIRNISVSCGLGCSYSLGNLDLFFFIGIALLVASSIGFLFVLSLTTKGGTTS